MGKYWAGVVDEYLKSSKPAVTTTTITTTTTTTTVTTTTSSETETTTATTSAQPKVTMAGDTNCDGQIDMSDVVLIMQALANPNKYAVGGTEPKALTAQGNANADVDKSVEGLTVNDALKIQQYLLGIIKSFD
ncbi:MAG: dockerin type I repeat-containing protein [Oscillospiraceae bacterium]|nr:dockerin type I repeat-containing protein [Oscillospiraceae bacterium]